MKPELINIKIGQPAHRALRSAGIENLEQLTQYKEYELLALHGFGPKALGILKSTLAEYGLTFKVDDKTWS
jgi:DNA-directed RNA polymerase alpha subunit